MLDAIFLSVWVIVQYLVNWLIENLELGTVDRLVLYIFQLLFAISTLAPVALTIYRDIRVMFIRTQREIHEEIRLGEGHESD